MGDFEKHIKLAKEKLKATAEAYENKQSTVVGDLGTKVVEQLVEADAARNNEHFGDHQSRHEYSNKNFSAEVNKAMRKIWFAYGDLGYDGVNGKRAKEVMDNLKIITGFFEKRLGVKINE
ncbi:MAG: hypothetical protein A3G38_04450 [Omnitrophica WOR_2 bacterium RIFCSPLOWO2_12_FULL_51_8]|nr:MAG: hypothetical protein A3G38_04450 [Omnitrophica WOR_2 bacterium RIFCSPLOWO2_12_FULL_51_8]